MSCQSCQQHWFWKKIGRCQRCMNQLMVLSVICWFTWWLGFHDEPKTIESITLLMAGVTFNGLLGLHLLMRFVVLPWRRKR
ncbi:DUF3624 domain-containing protein [Vibrio sp. FNV 38]|nr:DUF3624 domain-containing protein [Vibrio sp. FNV 38]